MLGTASPQTNRRRLLLAAPVLLLLGLAPPALALTAPPPTRTTTFTGSIVSATGRYAHSRGAVRLVLVGRTTTTGPKFKLTFAGPSCASQKLPAPNRCVALTGTVTGTATAARSNPDVGAQFALTGSGRVAPLGSVRLKGTTHGLGFIAHGRFPLTVTLSAAGGSVTVTAQSALVAGFSSPF